MKSLSRKIRITVVLFALVGFLAGLTVTPAYAQADDPVLSVLPQDTLFVLRINNFSYSLGQLDQYLAGASPIPMGLSMMLNMQLAGILGDPMLTGIDRGGTFAVAGFMPPDASEPMLTFLFPTTDFQGFIQANQNAQETADQGIYRIESPNSMLGALVVAPLPNSKFMLVGNGAEPEEFKNVLSMIKTKQAPLSQAVVSDETKRAAEAPAWLWLNLETGYQLAAPMIQGGISEALEGMEEQPGMEQTMPFMQAYAEGADQFLRQLRSLTVTLTPKPDVLLAETWLNAKDGTDLASALVRKQEFKKGYSLAGYLDPDAPVYFLGKINQPLWTEMYNMVLGLLANGTENAEFQQQFKQMIEKSMAAVGDEYAASFTYGSGQPPFSVTEVVAVKDPQAFRDLMAESTALTNQFYAKMGLDAQLNIQNKVETYKGVAIDMASIKFQFPEDAPAEQHEAIKAMYGEEGIQYPFVITDKALFLAMGPNAMTELKSLIDKSQSAAVPADVQTAQKLLPDADTADMLATVDLLSLMKGLSEMMETMQQAMPEEVQGQPNFAAMFEGIPMESQSAMALALRAEDGRLKFQYALPKQHLMEITNTAMQIYGKMSQQQQMGESWQPGPGEGQVEEF